MCQFLYLQGKIKMKFQNSLDKKYYNTLEEALLNPRRKKMWEENKKNVEEFKIILYDSYEVEDVYLMKEFFDTTKLTLDKLPILVKLNKQCFEEMVDNHFFESLKYKFKYFVFCENKIYILNDGWILLNE